MQSHPLIFCITFCISIGLIFFPLNPQYTFRSVPHSGAVRIIPVLNLFTKTDLTKKETWIGQQSMKKDKAWWLKTDKSIIDQYGLIAFLISMLLVYSCMIHRFFSIETLFFLFFMGFSINNIYYSWGCLMVMTTIGWLQKQKEQGILITENEMKDE